MTSFVLFSIDEASGRNRWRHTDSCGGLLYYRSIHDRHKYSSLVGSVSSASEVSGFWIFFSLYMWMISYFSTSMIRTNAAHSQMANGITTHRIPGACKNHRIGRKSVRPVSDVLGAMWYRLCIVYVSDCVCHPLRNVR